MKTKAFIRITTSFSLPSTHFAKENTDNPKNTKTVTDLIRVVRIIYQWNEVVFIDSVNGAETQSQKEF